MLRLIETDKRVYFKEPEGKRYEDRYGQYLAFFKDIAETPDDVPIIAHDVPWCWVPLLHYLRCTIVYPSYRFQHCPVVRRALWLSRSAGTGELTLQQLDRTTVEVLCGFRPECVDALYKIDMQWCVSPRRVKAHNEHEFIVTNNGSFHRHEVMGFLQELQAYTPTKRKVVLVPCAADKPYPAPLHKAVLDMLPDDYYLAIATGVLGIVPQAMWGNMPHYDSGIPNQWRLFEIARNYFWRTPHEHIVVYCDFYAHVLNEVFLAHWHRGKVDFVLSPAKYDDYVDLLAPENLGRLQQILKEG